jgi:hypothetical protein
MKQLVIVFFLVGLLSAKGQDVCHGAVISTVYGESKYFEVIDTNHQLDFTVSRQKRKSYIQTSHNLYRLEKEDELFLGDSLISRYNKGAWQLPSGKTLIETRTEEGWEYRLNGELILNAYFSLDRVEDCYYLCFDAKEWSEESKLSAYLVAGRFTKSVPMSRISLTAEDMLDIFVDVLYFLSI